jgi:putative endonuclease
VSGEKIEFGQLAEKTAVTFLKNKGYKIRERNYRTKFGEIDIIAQDKDVLVFIEVKARHSLKLGSPGEAVFARKQRQISKAAINYLKINKLLESAARFDVVSLLYKDKVSEISLIKDAFELSATFTL